MDYKSRIDKLEIRRDKAMEKGDYEKVKEINEMIDSLTAKEYGFYEKKEYKNGGMVRGTGRAIRGNKFRGVF